MAAIALGILLIVIVGAVVYFSSAVIRPTGHVCKLEHYTYCQDPSQLGLTFEDITLRTADGLRLSGWFIPGRPGAGSVLLVHGHGATRREGLRYTRALHDAGFHLLMIDTRGTGKSDPSFVTMGFLERRDVHAAVDYLLVERRLGPVGVMGFSMGAATSIMAMAEDDRIAAGVFEAGFSSVAQVLADQARYSYHLPEYPLLPLVKRLIEARAGISLIDPTPINSIAKISPRPVFIIHGRDDQTVRHHEGEKLFAAAKEPKRFWSHTGGHTRAWQADTEYARTEIPRFFAQQIPTGR